MFKQERAAVAAVMARLYDRGLTSAGGGNVSMRLPDGLMAVTPSGGDKGALDPDSILVVDIADGSIVHGDGRASMECSMHRLAYQRHGSVMAIVHSHPFHASLFSALEEDIDTSLLAEDYLLLGNVVKAPYALMGTQALAENVSVALDGHFAVLLENHGALTVGKDLLQAFERMEVLERAARMTLVLSGKPNVHHLDSARLAEIAGMRC